MLRFVKEDPLEIVVCFPLKPIRLVASPTHADESTDSTTYRPWSNEDLHGDDPQLDASQGGGACSPPPLTAALCASSLSVHDDHSVLGDDDDDVNTAGPMPPAPCSSGEQVWLHRSVTGSSSDLNALLAPTTTEPASTPSLHVKAPANGLHVLSHAPNGELCCVLDSGTAVVCCLSKGHSDAAPFVYAELGRIALRRPLRSTPHIGCTLSFLEYERQRTFCVAADEDHCTAPAAAATVSPRGNISFQHTDEVEEFVVSSAVHRVCFLCPDRSDAMLAVVLFRCGRLGSLAMTAAAQCPQAAAAAGAGASSGSSGWCVRPQSLSTRDTKRTVPLELAAVPHRALCVVTYHTHAADAAPTTTLAVVDAIKSTILLEWLLGAAPSVPTPIACTAPVAKDKDTDIFHVWSGGTSRRVLHRTAVEVRAAAGGPAAASDTYDQVVRAWDCSALQATAERSYFADSNIELPQPSTGPANPMEASSCGPLSPSGGSVGHCTPELMQLLSALGNEPVVGICTTGTTLVAPTLLLPGTKQLVATTNAAYTDESIVVLVWPQAVLLVDPNYDEGANVVGVLRMTRWNDCFVRAWIDTRRSVMQGDLLLHTALRDGGINTYRLVCHRGGANPSLTPVTLPLAEIVLLETVRGNRSNSSATWMFPLFSGHGGTDAALSPSQWCIVQLTANVATNTSMQHQHAHHGEASLVPASSGHRCAATVWRKAADGAPLERIECLTPTSITTSMHHRHHHYHQRQLRQHTTDLLRIQIVDIDDGPVVLMTMVDGTVSCCPLGGQASDVAVLRHSSQDTLGHPPYSSQDPTTDTDTAFTRLGDDALHDASAEPVPACDAAITSALLTHRVAGANSGVLLLVTGHADGTVEIWRHRRCIASHLRMHLAAVEHLAHPVDGGSAFLRERVAFMSVSALGGTVVLHGRAPTYGPLRRLSGPFEAISRILWDTSTDVVMLTGCTSGCSNVWLASSGRLERVVACQPDAQQALAASPRISVLSIPLRPPPLVAANAVCDYTTVSFVGCTEHVFQIAMSPLLACVHAEVTASLSRRSASQYRDTSPTSPVGCLLSKRVSLALAHCLAVVGPNDDDDDAATYQPRRGVLAPPFEVLYQALQLPRHSHPSARCVDVSQLLKKSGAQTTRIYILLLSLLKVLEPLAGAAVTGPCATYLLVHVMDLPPPSASSSPPSSPTSPLALPCVAACVPYVLHNLIAVQEAAQATMDAVVRRLSPTSAIRLLQGDPLEDAASSSSRAAAAGASGAWSGGSGVSTFAAHQHISAEEHTCLGRVILAIRLSHSPLMAEESVRQTVTEVARELETHITAWATESSAPPVGPKADLAASPPATTIAAAPRRQPVVLSVFSEAWLLWEAFMAHGEDTMDLVFAKCVAEQQSIDYRLNHGARALVAIGGRNFNRFVLLAERWFLKVAWRAPLILLFARLVQQHPSAMVVSFPTAVLHFVWMAVDPHTPHRADREAACVAVAQLFRMSVHVLPNIAFNQALQHLVVGHEDGQVYLYDAKAARVLSCFHSHAAPIACVAYHSGTTQEIAVVSAALDVVRFWRVGRSHGIMGLLSSVSGGTTCHVVGAVDIPLSDAARTALSQLPNQCMPPEMIATSCRLAWLSPNCVELQTPWHNRMQLTVGYGK